MDGTTTKEDVRIDKDDADELNREAAEDLERIENEVKREAEQYVEAVDGDGNEKESVEAAATAFDFDRAEAETEKEKYGKLCDDAGKESAALLERTREEAEKTAAGIIGSAKADAEKLISDANANIAAREREAVSGMKDDVVDLSLSIASKLIARNIDNGDNRRLAADFFEKELGGMKR